MKRIWLIVLSFLLLYGSVVWALDACLRHAGDSEHAVADDHHGSQGSTEQTGSQDPSVPVIHCTSVIYPLGPAALVAPSKLILSSEGVPLQSSLFPEAVLPVFDNNLWLEALFKKIVTFSLPNHLARHLFLSVLQI